LALTSLTKGGRSVGIVPSQTQAMGFSFSFPISFIFAECSILVIRFNGPVRTSVKFGWHLEVNTEFTELN
jgi:hypothetical protein